MPVCVFLNFFGQGSVVGMQCTLGHSLLGIQFTVVIFTSVFKLSCRHIPTILLWLWKYSECHFLVVLNIYVVLSGCHLLIILKHRF